MRSQRTRSLATMALVGAIALAGCSTTPQMAPDPAGEMAPAADAEETPEPDPRQEAYSL